jgi:heme-degrading monooxygenase HmoA
MIAKTPEPPYYVVLFTAKRSDRLDGYAEMAEKMVALAHQQPGFLGMETAHEEIGITLSYWTDEDAIANWKNHADHTLARELGRKRWYEAYSLRVARVERAYTFQR